jgi:hypothetical protein
MNTDIQLNQTAEGFYGLAVVGADGQIKRVRNMLAHNLILNQGMDAVASYSWANCMAFAAAGVGTTPTYRASGAARLNQVGDQVTFDTAQTLSAGDTLVYYGTNTAKITGVTSSTQVTVHPPMTSSGWPTFDKWYTSQAALASESKRAGLGIYNTYYVAGTEWAFTQDVGNHRQMRRTWDFSPETVLTRYTELGVSWSPLPLPAGGLFSRILLDVPEDIDVGERLRVIYQLNVVYGPTVATAGTPTITGWSSTAGSGKAQRILSDWINNSGTTVSGTGALEPYSSGNVCKAWLSTSDTALQAWGYALSRATPMSAQASTVKEVFTSGTWSVDKTARFGLVDVVSSNIRSTGVGFNDSGLNSSFDGTNQAYAFVFDNPQTKANTQRLNLTYRFSWDRVLSTENITL